MTQSISVYACHRCAMLRTAPENVMLVGPKKVGKIRGINSIMWKDPFEVLVHGGLNIGHSDRQSSTEDAGSNDDQNRTGRNSLYIRFFQSLLKKCGLRCPIVAATSCLSVKSKGLCHLTNRHH